MKSERCAQTSEATRSNIQERIEMIDFYMLIALESGDEAAVETYADATRILQFLLTIQHLVPRWASDINDDTIENARTIRMVSDSEISQVVERIEEIKKRKARYRRVGSTPMSNA